MSQPKPFTVVLLLAVFACVALYVLGVGLGAQQGSTGGRNPVSRQERERWRERLVKPGAVAQEDLKTAGCALSEGAVRVARGRVCQVDIATSKARVRTLPVEPLTGSRVDVKLSPHGGPSLPVSLEDLGERRGLDIPGEGATLLLTCTQAPGGTSDCPVKLR